MSIQHATKRLIDSVWTTVFTVHSDSTVTILRYDRENPIGYEQEGELPKGKFIEDDDRTAIKFDLDGEVHEIRNPRHVFTYKA